MNERSIFLEALEIVEPDARAAYLDRACHCNPALRLGVEELLSAHGRSGSFMVRPAVGEATADHPPIAERPGTVLGPYKLLEQIGEGGMGLVFVAEQQEPVRRKVALKIIKPGLDSKQVIARFEAERQALALMDHQNIARVFDAGTTESGRPYFVMELVHGIPITDYCDANKLTPRERLELFLPVCHAIQHAHQKGIIHRDLKPSNILVTMYDDKPVPKVIDFGVAKAVEQRLTEKTLFTQFGMMVGTFEYMSPEQAEMNAFGVDTRSDIYSLGVLLYELLTGTTPLERQRFREAAYGEIVRLIKEEDPPRPSIRLSTSGELAKVAAARKTEPAKLPRLMRGELDWVVMRCLEKDRARRYETANGLARDVERYLKDEPVEACPPSAGYRLRKLARKHHRLLTTAAAIAVVLLLAAAVSTWQAVRATRAEAVALANERQAEENAAKAESKEQEARDENKKVQAAQAELRSTLYVAQMNLAQHAWETASGRMEELLERQRPGPGETDLRGFEWHYLDRLCHSDLLTLKGHTFAVWSVAFSPDGKHLASASDDRTIRVWDAETGKVLHTLKGHRDMLRSVAFSPKGKYLASASLDSTVKVWDAQKGEEIRTIQGGRFSGGVTKVCFSPDGKRLAAAFLRGRINVWDAHTGERLFDVDGGGSEGMAFSPDGKRLAGTSAPLVPSREGKGGQRAVVVWDTENGNRLHVLQGGACGVAFSPDGKRIASGSLDRTVKVWDAETGKEMLTLQGHTARIWSVAFSPDSKTLASASLDRTVRVWDAETGKELVVLKGHSESVYGVAFSLDGKRLASASGDNTVKVWDAQASPNPRTLRGEGPGRTVAVSPDGKLLARAETITGPGGFGKVSMWDAGTGKELMSLKAHSGFAFDVAFSPDGKTLASAGREAGIDNRAPGEVKMWDAQTGKELRCLKGAGNTVLFSPDGQRLYSARGFSERGTRKERPKPYQDVKVWDAQTGKELVSQRLGGGIAVGGAAFSPDGKRIATASLDPTVKVWDAETGQELLTLKGHMAPIRDVAFSPDGQRIVSASLDRTVKVWDAETGKERLTLKGHSSHVESVAFSPDGKRLASAAADKTVKLWDARSGQELLTLPLTGGSPGPGGSGTGDSEFAGSSAFMPSFMMLQFAAGPPAKVAFSPDGRLLTGVTGDGTVLIWDATPRPAKR